MTNPQYDVAIIGLGPVGATAAILFAEAGLNVVVIERDIEVYKLPRAVNLDGEIVRAFQSIGLADEVDALLQTVRPGDRGGFANSKREWMFGTNFKDFGSNGWQPNNMFDQPELESYLRTNAEEHPNVTAFIGMEACSFRDGMTAVDILVKNMQQPQEDHFRVRARYLLACDGAASPTRKALGIEWHDLGYDHEWLVVDVTTFPGHTLTNDTVQVCDPDRISTYVATKDPYRRWEFKLLPHETREEMLDPERIKTLIDPWTPRGTYELRRAAVYQFHAATAGKWRAGNVFLAGDAAHQTPPFLGQGMNAGMRDVINFAWKLALVCQGVAEDKLLDSYGTERTAHATDLVEWAVAIGHLMEHQAAIELAQRQGKALPKTPASLKSSGYGQGRESPPIRAGVLQLDQISDKGSTGYLFSQPIVTTSGGHTCKLDALLGPGFALVYRGDLSLNEHSAEIVSRLNIKRLNIEKLNEQRGHFDNVFRTSRCALIRPDRIVYGHTTDTVDENMLLADLEKQLALLPLT
ncbi:bifunctional 3-(3-hydroxy-phenyl)propionate/3-hydroxycinnamic acid hydroxylase [Pseudomonadales bacterium]|nr:bifunctional 3-(3-hydroxy-phenyl)propionate/3-hydroxycinnamic acid hydroxylase [Pseudomonadales bacterium]MDC1019321.1 bifunctional 3-(3-hydroxy-phenyl)propionate/3-hydroxycinnamic acid hydroxylase [Pseudomonadales bacterium]|tara:strand:- start:1033 stop:2598 length:1566 start_codon:yes stop_codon:yes gene_type:complete